MTAPEQQASWPTPEQLDAIQARADAATEGPWKTVRHDLSLYVESRYASLQANLGYVGNHPEANADFIAHARTDIPALLTLVRSQQVRLDEFEAKHGEHTTDNQGRGCPACAAAIRVKARERAALTATEGA